MHTSDYVYHDGAHELKGFIAYDERASDLRPAVLVVHDWSGRNAFACHKAEVLAGMGYVGFAIDMYGQGTIGTTVDEKQALMSPLINDRLSLRSRIMAAYDAILKHPKVDPQRIAVIGFCFGGLCALDLARSGADIRGAVSFHGLLSQPHHGALRPIKAKILALHGYDDPMVRPDDVTDFCEEMTQAKADWQVHMYGHTQHAFTNPDAHDAHLGTIYDEVAAHRSWLALTQFLVEIFA